MLYGNACICMRSGFLHYCTAVTCDKLTVYSDCMTCDLVGYSYPLDLDIGWNQYTSATTEEDGEGEGDEQMDPANADDYGEVIEETRRDEVNEVAVPTPAVDQLQHEAAAAATSAQIKDIVLHEEDSATMDELPSEQVQAEMNPEPSKPNKSTRDTDPGNHEERVMRCEFLLRAVFKHTSGTSLSLLQNIARNAARLWLLIRLSPVFKRKKQNYVLEYHLLAVLQLMRTGFAPLQKELIPMNAWVAKHVPPVRLIARIGTFNVKVPRYTKTLAVFRESFREFVTPPCWSEFSHQLQWIKLE
jgi:hypothetical protein